MDRSPHRAARSRPTVAAARRRRSTLTARRAGRTVVSARALGRATGPRAGASVATGGARRSRLPRASGASTGSTPRRLRLAFPRRSLELLVADDGVAFRARGAHRDARPLARPRRQPRLAAEAEASITRSPYRRDAAPRRAPRATYAYPALLRTPAGDSALLSESGLPRGAPRPATSCRARAACGWRSRPARRPDRAHVVARSPCSARAATIVGSDLPLALGRPFADRRRVLDPCPAAPPGRGGRTRRARGGSRDQQRHVDAAAAAGWEYVLVDEGWDAAWLPELVAYAAAARRAGPALGRLARPRDAPRARAVFLDRHRGLGRRRRQARLPRVRPAPRMRFMAAAARAAARRELRRRASTASPSRAVSSAPGRTSLTFEGVLRRGARQARPPDRPGARRRPRLHPQRDRLDGLHAGGALRPRPGLDDGAPAGAGDRLRVRPPAATPTRPESYAAHPAALALLEPRPRPRGTTPGCSRASPARYATVARRAGRRLVRRRALGDARRGRRRSRSASSAPARLHRDGHHRRRRRRARDDRARPSPRRT